jgi:hypothetical protein
MQDVPGRTVALAVVLAIVEPMDGAVSDNAAARQDQAERD